MSLRCCFKAVVAGRAGSPGAKRRRRSSLHGRGATRLLTWVAASRSRHHKTRQIGIYAELIPSSDYYISHNTPWKGDPNSLPPCAPPAGQPALNGGCGVFAPSPRTHWVKIVFSPNTVPQGYPALTPMWMVESEAAKHAMEGRGKLLDETELGDETLETLATAKEVIAQRQFYIIHNGQIKFSSPDDLVDETGSRRDLAAAS